MYKRQPENISLNQIAVASLRIEEAPNARVHLAESLLLSGQPHTARRTLMRLLQVPQAPLIGHAAWRFTATAAYDIKDYSLCMKALDCAARLGYIGEVPLWTQCHTLIHRFIKSLYQRDTHRSTRAADELDDYTSLTEPSVTSELECLRASVAAADYQPAEVRLAIQPIASKLGPVSGSVAHVFM